MSTDKYSELESKFNANHVTEHAFKEWCFTQNPKKFESIGYPDVYYRHGDDVVRHRLSSETGELTVKRRKSTTSIRNRVEVDLRFADDIKKEDVVAFLEASGWEHDLTLVKNFSHVFWFTHGKAAITVALYEVKLEDGSNPRRFIEVELEKESDVTDEIASNLLHFWSRCLQSDLDLHDPLTESLYEIYSGRQYLINKELP